jgi:putative endonuclease
MSRSALQSLTPSLTRSRGDAAEQAALDYLCQQGLRVVARNVRFRVGEIDLIMLDANVCVFVEVRMRSLSRFGGAAITVNYGKRQRLIRAAHCWLQSHSRQSLMPNLPACRFDVVAIDGTIIDWIPNAFGLEGTL